MPLIEEAHKASRILLDNAYVRIVARAEPDAVCAAALLAHALRRESVDVHATWAPRLTPALAQQLADERNDCVLAIGLSQDAHVEEFAGNQRIVVEAVPPTLRADALVHGADASLASLAHLLAAGLSKRNRDLAPLAIAGALAAQRHVGGLRGLDAEIVQEAVEASVVLREPALGLSGPTLLQALAQLDAPYVAGVTGRARNVKKLVTDLQLAGDSPPGALAPEEAEKVGSFLALRLLQQGAPDAALDALFPPTIRALQGPHTGLACGDLARLAEAACAAERPGLAFAALWPDPASGGEMVEVQTAFREELIAALLRAERDARVDGAMLVSEAARAGLCAPLADRLALTTPRAAVVHAGETIALRRHGEGADLLAAAKRAAEATGGRARGSAHAARVEAPDVPRALKALAEALA